MDSAVAVLGSSEEEDMNISVSVSVSVAALCLVFAFGFAFTRNSKKNLLRFAKNDNFDDDDEQNFVNAKPAVHYGTVL